MPALILFDGLCNLCNGAVIFIIKRDPKKYFEFASLQSAYGQEALKKYNVAISVDTIVLIDNAKVYVKSEAALRIAKHLSGVWQIFYLLKIIPKFIRDYCYDYIAANRYRFFGKRDACMVPSEDLKSRFRD